MFLRSLGYDPADVKSTQKFWKDVERGVLQSAEVIPKLGKAFDEAAEKNGAFAKASQTNSREMQRMSNAFQEFQDAIFKGGFAEGLNDTFKLFADILQSAKPMANVLGGAFGGAIEGLILPFRIVNALVKDFFKLLNIDGIDTKMLNITLRWIGMAAGITVLVKSLRALYAIGKKLRLGALFTWISRLATSNPIAAGVATGAAATISTSRSFQEASGMSGLEATMFDKFGTSAMGAGLAPTQRIEVQVSADENGLMKAAAKATEQSNSDLASKINTRHSD